MEDKENVQLCTRCSSVLANHVMDNSKSVPYCSACAVQGRAPPLLCRCRNSSDVDSDDFVRTAQLNKSNGTLSVVDNGGHVHTESLDDTPQNVLPSSAELTEFTCQNSNTDSDCSSSFCNSLVSLSQEVDIASSDQLQDSQCASRCRPKQSSVERLRKQMEMLAHDEDFPVHYGITTDDHSALCCQSDVNEIDSEEHLMKYTAHSANCDEVLPSINVEDDDDGLIVSNMCQAVRPKSQRHLDGCTSDVSSDAVMSGQNCNSPFNSVRGCVVLGCLFVSFKPISAHLRYMVVLMCLPFKSRCTICHHQLLLTCRS